MSTSEICVCVCAVGMPCESVPYVLCLRAMRVCGCVYMCARGRACVRVCVTSPHDAPSHKHTHTYARTHARTHTHTHTHTHTRSTRLVERQQLQEDRERPPPTHTHIRTHARTHTHTRTRDTRLVERQQLQEDRERRHEDREDDLDHEKRVVRDKVGAACGQGACGGARGMSACAPCVRDKVGAACGWGGVRGRVVGEGG